MSGIASTASANTGEVQFIGAVTDTTCNINPEVDGVMKSTIQLGTMKTDGSGTQDVYFNLVPDTEDCLKKTSASVGWQSAGFDNNGLVNMKGDATGASIELVAVNSKVANEKVTFNKQNIEFGNGTDAIGKFQFKTKLVKNSTTNATPGTVISSAAYAVAYK
ncbi:TPA: fimbrial protein [Salmonella enterica]|uniref:Fimbrial protein n=2 Tax=Salmonella enterica TaxID=28901 RepID=A0A759HAI3_SALER|nr:fimbrial protein [Salmonella enterica]ECA1898278.1 fimbrial protein [Salmonella enterica subsp. enterica serovar Eastbourne]HAC6678840.1 fimbrial protein [Salmonella enterica subsp. enterica serovar Eastbourne]HAE5116303.1 fimbrial protein [Salmonella enterica subsp. enterica serovar Eastbourne]HAG1883058.1 fimbrial protein [Salmonella enterica]